MEQKGVPFSKTNSFPSLVIDYLNGDAKTKDFVNYPPVINSFKQVIADKQKESTDRPLLVSTLNKQYAFLKNATAHREVSSNIAALADPKTFTVTTGHQLALFTGPLYFIYKIISTVALAEALKKQYGEFNFVPVFWMASEDHDFAEINHAHLFAKKLEWKENFSQAAGTISTATLPAVLSELKSLLPETENAAKLIRLFENAYNDHSNVSDAARFFVNELFGKYGVVCIDGNDTALKKIFHPVIKEELLNQVAEKKINGTIEKLKDHYKVQVNPRNINLFYLGENFRERIVLNEDGRYEVLNQHIYFTKEEIVKEAESNPERFSPNVVLRPLYEEMVLPNLAYIGGPGEISYWMELKGVFDHFKVNFPMLVARNRVMLIEKSIKEKMEKLGLTPEDIFESDDILIKKIVLKNSPDGIVLDAEKKKITEILDVIVTKAAAIDPTLGPSGEGEKQRILNSISALEAKLVKAEKKKQEVTVNQVKKLKEKLFPGGILQERYENFIPYYLEYGDEFISLVKQSFEPLTKDFTIIYL